MRYGRKYSVYDHFLGRELDPSRNYFQEILDDEGNLIGWRIVMVDGAGKTGDVQLVGYYQVDAEWVEEPISKIHFEEGRTACDVILGDMAFEGTGIGAVIAGIVSAGIGYAKGRTRLGGLIGAILGALTGGVIGRTIPAWRVRYFRGKV